MTRAARSPVERTLKEMLRDPGPTQFGVGEPWQRIDKWAEAIVRRAAEVARGGAVENDRGERANERYIAFLRILADAGLEDE